MYRAACGSRDEGQIRDEGLVKKWKKPKMNLRFFNLAD